LTFLLDTFKNESEENTNVPWKGGRSDLTGPQAVYGHEGARPFFFSTGSYGGHSVGRRQMHELHTQPLPSIPTMIIVNPVLGEERSRRVVLFHLSRPGPEEDISTITIEKNSMS
jgi:hypothetical protein